MPRKKRFSYKLVMFTFAVAMLRVPERCILSLKFMKALADLNDSLQ